MTSQPTPSRPARVFAASVAIAAAMLASASAAFAQTTLQPLPGGPGSVATPLVGGINEKPPIQIIPDKIDLGTIAPGGKTAHSVKIKNVGDKPLDFKEAVPTCKCTKPEMVKQYLEPGEETELLFEVTPGYTLGRLPRPRAIYVYFEPYLQPVVLEIMYEVSYPVRCTPHLLRTEDIEPDRKGEITLVSIDEKPFRVLRVNNAPVVYADGFDAAKDAPRNKYVVKWDLSQGRMPPWMIIETDRADCPVMELDLLHDEIRLAEREAAIGKLHVTPGGWNFNIIPAGQPKRYDVKVYGVIDAPQELTVSSPFSQDITARIISWKPNDIRDGKMVYTIEVRPRDGFEGMFLVPLYFKRKDEQYRAWVFGRVEQPESKISQLEGAKN